MKEPDIIRRLYRQYGLSLCGVEQRMGLTRKIPCHWLKLVKDTILKHQRKPTENKIAPPAVRLTKMLKTDLHRTKRDCRSVLKLFAELKAIGSSSDYSRDRSFIWQRHADGGVCQAKAYLSLHFGLGLSFQLDRGEEHLVIGGTSTSR
jgi:hypothetical protein